jgi:hypothetical protein
VPGSADETDAAEYRSLLFSIAYDKLGHLGPVSDLARLPEKE